MLEQQVVIIGAGGHGHELRSYLRDLAAAGGAVRFAGFVDENKSPDPWIEILGGLEEVTALLAREPHTEYHYLIAIGDNGMRRAMAQKAEACWAGKLMPWTLQHPSAQVGYDVVIGAGSCLAPGSIVTTRVRLGQHCILNAKASIAHDCVVGDFANINPGATLCGCVTIGTGCNVGAGATVIDRVSIGEWTTIGAGAVVVDDIPPHVTAVGVPARVIKRHVPNWARSLRE